MIANTVALNQEDVDIEVVVLDESTGLPYDGLDDTASGLVLYYARGTDVARVTDGGSAADLASLGAAHSDWGFLSKGYGGKYRFCVPDAAFAEGEGQVDIGIEATGYTCIVRTITISPLIKFQGNPASTTTTTTTIPAGQKAPLKGDIIMVVDGTGEIGNQVKVTSAALQVATHAAFETAISAASTTIALIAGEAISVDGGQDIDVKRINGASVIGAGTSGDKWRGS